MVTFYIFIMRIIIGGVVAVVLTRFFHPEFEPFYVAGVGFILVSLAYFFEYLRKNKSEE